MRRCYYTNGVDEKKIRRFKDGWVKTLIGGGGALTGRANTIKMFWPAAIGIDPKGDLYFRDGQHQGIIRKATFTGKKEE